MFTIQASQSQYKPLFITAKSEEFATREEAEALHANFPKYVNAKVTRLTYWDSREATYSVRLEVNLQPTKGNDRNEGGIRRYRAFRKVADTLGTVQFAPDTHGPKSWGYFTEAELEDAIKSADATPEYCTRYPEAK